MLSTSFNLPAPSDTLWALADCNNFYASCEKLFRPDLTNKPVVVLSSNDGCIVSRSPEAKALGIAMGEPEFKVRAHLRALGVKVFSSNYALYGDISQRVMDILSLHSPQSEQYSIDEAFLALSGANALQAEDSIRNMREQVRQWTGIQLSIGVAPTRTLSKIANHIAKKGQGLCVLPKMDAHMDTVLAAFPVEEVWGIGRRQKHKLYAEGIRTARDLQRANDVWVRKNLTISGWKTVLELRGLPCWGEDDAPMPRQSLVCSRSFGKKVKDKRVLAEALAAFTVRAAEKLRREGMTTSVLGVRIRTAHQAQGAEGEKYDASAQISLHPASSDTVTLLRAAQQGLEQVYRQGPLYAAAGVVLLALESTTHQQGSLLLLGNEEQSQRRKSLMEALDGINHRFGRRTVRFGAEDQGQAAWYGRQEHCSPRMSSNWDELPIARCM